MTNFCLIVIPILGLWVPQLNEPYLFRVCIMWFLVLVLRPVEVLEPVPPFWTIPVRLAAQDLGSNLKGVCHVRRYVQTPCVMHDFSVLVGKMVKRVLPRTGGFEIFKVFNTLT